MKCPRCNSPSVYDIALSEGLEANKADDYLCPNRHSWFAPQAGPQRQFLSSKVDELLYGGAAGGGKSWGLVLGPLRWIDNPDFNALMLRRETPQLEALISLTRKIYKAAIPAARDVQAGGGLVWRFPSGARLTLAHCKDEADAFNYTGREFQWVGFDELTHFMWSQYQEIRSRIRSPYAGLPRYLRATSNPGGEGHEWVFNQFAPWLNPKFEVPWKPKRVAVGANGEEIELPPFESGEVAYIEITSDGEKLIRKPEVFNPRRHRTRLFIGATLEDNRILYENDPGYEANLEGLDTVRREQLKRGDWLIKPAPGLYFKRAWFKFVDAVPAKGMRVRYWDRAGSEKDRSDWTVGLRMIRAGDLFYVDDVVRMRGDPGEVQDTIVNTATMDGKDVMQVLELDPGQAGLVEMSGLIKALKGFNAQPWRPTGDKVVRASAVSPQVRAGNVFLLKRPWNEAFISELESFPDDTQKDDQVDALSGAFSVLVSQGGAIKGGSVTAKTSDFESSPIT